MLTDLNDVLFYLDADKDGAGGGGDDPKPKGDDKAGEDSERVTWEGILEGLPAPAKAAYEEHTKGLKSALQSERDKGKDLAKKLKELSAKAEEGSELKSKIDSMSSELEAATTRAEFILEAVKPEIGCTNPELAWIVAEKAEAIDRRGRVNWELLKKDFPELFGKKSPPKGGAGDGTGNSPPKGKDMNDWIRAAAGRR